MRLLIRINEGIEVRLCSLYLFSLLSPSIGLCAPSIGTQTLERSKKTSGRIKRNTYQCCV